MQSAPLIGGKFSYASKLGSPQVSRAVPSRLVVVKSGHLEVDPIRDVGFRPPAGTPTGVEVIDFARLRTLSSTASFGLQRPHFHQLIVVTSGALALMVDFVDHVVEPGTWLWVRPGQIQRWGDLAAVQGELVLFETEFLDRDTAAMAQIDDPGVANVFQPGDGGVALDLARSHLTRELDAFGDLPLTVHLATLRHLLAVLVLHLAHTAPIAADSPTGPNETFRRFRMAVEQDFAHTRSVERYATLLGYSPRTLTRATRSATGGSAKEFIDQRVTLEAKRLLAHTDRTAARVARDLGFDDAANFSKFFQHRTAMTPTAFRRSVREAAGAE